MAVASSKSSGLLSASTDISHTTQLLNSVQVNTDGTNDATITVYDTNTGSAAGTVLSQMFVSGASKTQTIVFTFPIKADLGLYVQVTGTGAKCIIGYGAS